MLVHLLAAGRVVGVILHRDELVENTVVEHEQQRRIVEVALDAEETLTGIIRLHIMHVGFGNQLLVLLVIGCERHAPVEEHFQVGPYLVERLLAADLQDTGQHTEHPRRYTAQVGHVLLPGLVGNALALQLKVVQQRCLLLRHAYQVGQRVDILDEDSAQVAHQTALHIVVRRVASAQDERAPVEQAALRVVAQIEGYAVETASIVDMLQTLVRYRDKLRLVVGRSRRLGIPFHLSRP